MDLSKKIKITVCADGFVSIMEKPSDRRQRAALPVHSTDTVEQAFMLVNKVCILGRCAWGGKIGTTIEPKAPNWPRYGGSLDDMNDFAVLLQKTELEINPNSEINQEA